MNRRSLSSGAGSFTTGELLKAKSEAPDDAKLQGGLSGLPASNDMINFGFDSNNSSSQNESIIYQMQQLLQQQQQPGRKRKAQWDAAVPQQQQQQQVANGNMKNTPTLFPVTGIDVATATLKQAALAQNIMKYNLPPPPPLQQHQQHQPQFSLPQLAQSQLMVQTMGHNDLVAVGMNPPRNSVHQQQLAQSGISPMSLYQSSLVSSSDMNQELSWCNPAPMMGANTKGYIQPCQHPGLTRNNMRDVLATGKNKSLQLQQMRMRPVPFSVDPQQVVQTFISCAPDENTEPSMLHRSLTLFPDNLSFIRGALELDPRELCRKARMPPADSNSNIFVKQSYGYPLNIALQNNASMEVLHLLATGAPHIVTARDGRDESGSLLIALRQDPKNTHALHLLIKANPLCMKMTDRRRNTPLHVAVARGASLAVVRAICMLYPAALLQSNLNGETPLLLAQRSTNMCKEDVCNYIQDAYHEELLQP